MASINTNPSNLTALRNLNSINRSSSSTQNQVSTGLRVGNALSDASNFSIAQGTRGELRAFSALSQGLNNGSGIANVGLAGATGLSDLTTDIRVKLTELANEGNTAEQTQILQNDLDALLEQAGNFIENSNFNGSNVLESGAADVNVLANAEGDTVTIEGQGNVADTLTALQGASGGDAATILANEFADFESAINTALGDLGANARQLQAQDGTLQEIADATEEGLGNIVDADLGRASALQASQQAQSQLSILSVGITNQSAGLVAGLFR